MKSTVLILAFVVSAAWQFRVVADEPFHSLEAEVVKILRTKYPDAKLDQDKVQKSVRTFTRNMRELLSIDWTRVVSGRNPGRSKGRIEAESRCNFRSRRGNGKGKWRFLAVPQL